jgi:hypothetical protein
MISLDIHPHEKNMFSTLEYNPVDREWKSDRIVAEHIGELRLGSGEWEKLPDKYLLIDHLFEANHGAWR